MEFNRGNNYSVSKQGEHCLIVESSKNSLCYANVCYKFSSRSRLAIYRLRCNSDITMPFYRYHGKHYDYSAKYIYSHGIRYRLITKRIEKFSNASHRRALGPGETIPIEGNSVNRGAVSRPQPNGLFTIITWRANFGLIVAPTTGTPWWTISRESAINEIWLFLPLVVAQPRRSSEPVSPFISNRVIIIIRIEKPIVSNDFTRLIPSLSVAYNTPWINRRKLINFFFFCHFYIIPEFYSQILRELRDR